QLNNKACLKQKTYKNIQAVFEQLKREAFQLIEALRQKMVDVDQSVTIAFHEVNAFQFHMKFGGDLLVFVLKSNIVTFGPEYPIMQSDYTKEKEQRKYF